MGAFPSSLVDCFAIGGEASDGKHHHHATAAARPGCSQNAAEPCTDGHLHEYDRVGHYTVLRRIGSGHFASVFAVRDERDCSFHAMKVLRQSTRNDLRACSTDYRREVAIAMSMDHTNIIQVHDLVQEGDIIGLVMEIAGTGTLFEVTKEHGGLYADEARALFREVGSAVAHCHEHGVAHRDIKPENVVLKAAGEARLVDFGLATSPNVRTGLVHGRCGTMAYVAPEVLWAGDVGYDGAMADVFALGVTFFATIHDRLPFTRERVVDGVVMTTTADLSFDDDVPEALQELLLWMMREDPRQRPTIHQVLDSPWFSE